MIGGLNFAGHVGQKDIGIDEVLSQGVGCYVWLRAGICTEEAGEDVVGG